MCANNYLIIVFARPPVMGKVKTRLAADVGAVSALKIYKQLLSYTINTVEQFNSSRAIIAWSEQYYDKNLKNWTQLIQPDGSLGSRLRWAMHKTVGEKNAEKVLIIGADCPLIKAGDLQEAIDYLDHSQVVLGPCDDGGYYLVGTGISSPALFPDLPWGTDQVLKMTMESLHSAAISVKLMGQKYDIDTLGDWERYNQSQ